MKKTVGVLGLQGDFALHQKSLERINVNAPNIRGPEELDACDGLILPGGETTTFVKLLEKTGLFKKIQQFAIERPVMGTCAGLITLAGKIVNANIETLKLIDIEVERNGYGRQVDSFIDTVTIPSLPRKQNFEGLFIRAPRIRSLGKGVEALGFHNEDVVMARSQRILVMTFHPELTNDTRIHRFFLEEFVGK